MDSSSYTRPDHTAVDWSSERRDSKYGPKNVNVKCPECSAVRRLDANRISPLIRRGKFTGYCKSHCNLSTSIKVVETLNSLVDWSKTIKVSRYGSTQTHVQVTCPDCGYERHCSRSWVSKVLKKGTFTGRCHSCHSDFLKKNGRELGIGRTINPNGYVVLKRLAVKDEHLELFEKMRLKTKGNVLEHRFIMSVQIGRMLEGNELVDHMDGNKRNNELSNLRIYVKGKNQPGSHNGNGTYYQEWQDALAQIRMLRTELSELRNYMDTEAKTEPVQLIN